MLTDLFYSKLPTLNSFEAIVQPQNFVAVPNDWYILITDVSNSTDAIAAGYYKTVNFIGASSIIAVLNITKNLEVPFIFGGDGATILVPPSLLAPARNALLATRQLSQERFNMNLRVGVVPVSVVRDYQYEIKIAKQKVSENYYQAHFLGGGLTFATDLIKNDNPDNPYQLRTKVTQKPDFSGLECRWQDIHSEAGQILSLIIVPCYKNKTKENLVYHKLIRKLKTIYGDDENLHPVQTSQLKLTFNPKKLFIETSIRAHSAKPCHKFAYLINIILQNLIGLFLMNRKLTVGNTNWGLYRQGFVETTDYRKIDDVLRMVITSKPEQTKQLINYLKKQFKSGSLVYGLHISDRALMTCLIFERNGSQVHFVDGADGGYTLAAKHLKQQLHRKAKNWKTYTDMIHRRNKTNEPNED